MVAMRKYDNQFKCSVLEYVHNHKDLTVYECSRVFGVGYSTLNKWLRLEKTNKINIEIKSNGNICNLESENQELARLKQELHDAKKTLKVLKEAFELLGK